MIDRISLFLSLFVVFAPGGFILALPYLAWRAIKAYRNIGKRSESKEK